MTEDVDTVKAWIDETDRIVVLTGAGISTDSGIPDFRGPQGVWTKNPAAEKTATLQHYVADPEVRKRAWQGRRRDTSASRASPTPATARWSSSSARGRLHTLITQNVDGLHTRRGPSPDKVVEIHGTIREVVCLECGERAPMERALARVRAGEDDPPCRSCGGILKSATISFGQALVARGPHARRRGGARRATCCWPSARRSACTRWPAWCRSPSSAAPAS